jgi:hypothetical protein
VDGDPWAFDAIMISAGPSATGVYYYPPEWLTDPNTVKAYQGCQSYINHMSEEEMVNRPEGDMNELVGYWSNVKADPSMMTGRIHIVPTESNKRIRDYCLASIRYRQQFPDKNFFGVSIVQIGDWEPFEFQGKQFKKVVNTKEVHSTDIVTKPGRGGMILAPAPAQGESRRKWFTGYMAESMRMMDLELSKKIQKESVPAGWKGTVHAMLDHPEIDNPYALANWMDQMGYTPHKGAESGASASAFGVFDRPGTQRLVESEAQSEMLPILTELRDKVATADDSMPLKKDLRRGLDNAISLAQIGPVRAEGERTMPESTKQEITTKPGMTVSVSHAHPPASGSAAPPGAGPAGSAPPTAHQEPDADEEEATYCEEAAGHFQKMAESESEAGKKAGFTKQSEAFKKMAEAHRAKAAESKKQREAEAAKVKESEEEQEAARLKKMTEAEKEEEANRQVLVDVILDRANLDEKTLAFMRESTRGKNISEVRKMVETARTTLMREANPPLNPSRPAAGAGVGGDFKAAFTGFFGKKGGRN